MRGILVRKGKRTTEDGYQEYYGDFGESVEVALLRLRDNITEF